MMKELDDDFDFIPYSQIEESKSNNDFGFVPVHAYQKEEKINELPNENESIEQETTEPSFGQKVASHPITQIALGAAKFFTWPLDALKLAMQGEGLSDIDEIEEAFAKEGKPFDRNEYIRSVRELTDSIPTQQFIEDKVKQSTGIDLAPQDSSSRMLRQGAEILSTGPKGLIESGIKQIAKRGAGAALGAATTEGLKQSGAPEVLSDVTGYLLGGAAAGKSAAKKLSPEAKELTQIAEKHGLKQLEGIQREVSPKHPIISVEKQSKITNELHQSSKDAIEKVIEGKLPIKTLRDSGIDLKDAYTKAYSQADSTAKSLSGKNIDLQDPLGWISKKRQQIKSSAPSLSATDETLLKELSKHEKSFKTAKNVTPEQALNQYRKFNEEVSGIYRKPQFTGSENAVRGLYEDMKSEWIKSIRKTSPALADELTFANKIFSQTANLNMVEKILDKSFAKGYDPSRLNKTLGSEKSKAFLERALGKDAVKDMADIAKYGEKANEKVLSKLKQPKTALDIVTQMTPLKFGLLALKGGINFKTYGIPLAWDIGKSAINRAQGELITREPLRKSYIDYLKKAANPESPAFKKASQEFSKKIDEEFGSEEELIEAGF